MSSRVISLTPGTYGSLPAETVIADAACVKAEKFDFWSSFLRFSISSMRCFFSFFSYFISSCNSLSFWFYEAVFGLSRGALPKLSQSLSWFLSVYLPMVAYPFYPTFPWSISFNLLFSASSSAIFFLRTAGSFMFMSPYKNVAVVMLPVPDNPEPVDPNEFWALKLDDG